MSKKIAETIVSKEVNNTKNKLFYGDNLEILRDGRYIKDESIDLCYIDPPFNSKRSYNQIYNNIGGEEDRAQSQAFIDTWTWDDKAIEGFTQISENYNRLFPKQTIDLLIGLKRVLGEGDLMAYLVSITLRVAEIYRVLKPTGSFYFHCDATASHYLKLVLDSLFCSRSGDFKREIIWSTTDTSGFKSQAKNWIRSHDTILFYTKSKDFTFHKLFWEHNPTYLKRFKKTEVDGRKFRDDRPGKRKQYLEDTLGKNIGDVWDDIDSFQQASTNPEYMGYPTQKREAILERIITASSNEGDTILDTYCGCGTTVAVAQRLKRSWIGIDITFQSISLILKRLEETYGVSIIDTIELNGVPKDIDSAIALAHKKDDRVRKEFEKWSVLTYTKNKALINEKKGADHGIDGIAYMMEGKDISKDILFSVKSGNINLSMVRDFCHVIQRDNAAIGIFITTDKPTQKMEQEFKKMGHYINPLTGQEFEKAKFVTIEEILNGERINIPTSIDVLKKAEIKRNNNQSKFDF